MFAPSDGPAISTSLGVHHISGGTSAHLPCSSVGWIPWDEAGM